MERKYKFISISIIFALFLIIPNYLVVYKTLHAKDISSLKGIYHNGEYVVVNFNQILYLEYEDLYGKFQKNYSVCGTLDGEVYYVNVLPEEYILVEIKDRQMIQQIESSQKSNFEVMGIIQECGYDTGDFSKKYDSNLTLNKEIVIKQVQYTEKYTIIIFNGCMIILYGIFFIIYWKSKRI